MQKYDSLVNMAQGVDRKYVKEYIQSMVETEKNILENLRREEGFNGPDHDFQEGFTKGLQTALEVLTNLPIYEAINNGREDEPTPYIRRSA